jgi:hypothetical protein
MLGVCVRVCVCGECVCVCVRACARVRARAVWQFSCLSEVRKNEFPLLTHCSSKPERTFWFKKKESRTKQDPQKCKLSVMHLVNTCHVPLEHLQCLLSGSGAMS